MAEKKAKHAEEDSKKAGSAKKASSKRSALTAGKAAPMSPSELVDEQLERYRSMRDFSVTLEPSGSDESRTDTAGEQSRRQTEGLPFVIQKHAASHLHYDFRLGWNGVLKSWAVAKGPSYNTKDKRLAVQVEDHPIEYGGFEGVIPKGQYGGGTVMLWDTGTWKPQSGHTDVDAGLRDGSLKLTMHGVKMKGNWALIRMGGNAANASKPNWLLIKEHDSFERGETGAAITEEAPDSVVTGRSLEEIASSEDHVWNSNKTASGDAVERPAPPIAETKRSLRSAKKQAKKKGSAKKAEATDLESCPEEKLPDFIPPQLALQADEAVDREGWLHELKLDGYRIEARKDGGKVRLFTRSGLDWTHRMQAIAAEVAKLPSEKALLDGEVVVLSDKGTTSFADLQASFREGVKHALTYFVFDLLHLDGHNLRNSPLLERKTLLAKLLAGTRHSHEVLKLSEHIETHGDQVFTKACELDAEGIISKRTASKYTSGRSGDWLKVKCIHDQEFVVGGFTLPSNGIHGVGALLLGYYDADGQLTYAGRTGTGFTQQSHKLIRDQLEKLKTKAMPFANMPGAARRGAVWVAPSLVAQVNFATWTADNLVRQAAFKGLREDKPAKEVRREEAVPVDAVLSNVDAVLSNVDAVLSNVKPPGAMSEDTHKVSGTKAAKVKAAKTPEPGRFGSDMAKSQTHTEQLRGAQENNVVHAQVRLTHPEKILDGESKLTKQQLADYYWAVAESMLPEISDRPLSLVRCPEGSTQPCFFQKHSNHMLPPGIETVNVPDKKTGKAEAYITLSTREALAGLAQMGVLEVHPWGSKNDDLEHPDRIILDLDPDESIPWTTIAGSAQEMRRLLKSMGLESFLKSTGGKGLHVVVPIVPEHDWSAIKQFAHAIALHLEQQQPSLYLSKMSKAARKERIYIDYLRNERGSTAVAAFSPRARAGAPVSMPLSWDELKSAERPVFRVANFDEWKARLKRNPWKGISTIVQHVEADKVGSVLGG